MRWDSVNAKMQGREDARDIEGLASLRLGELALPDGFRDTPLGPLPETWKVASIAGLVKARVLWIKNGYPQGAHNQDSRGVPHLRPFNVTSEGNIDLSQIKYVKPPKSDSPYWVQEGDIIFNNTNSEELVGKTAFFPLDGDFVLSNHMTIIRVLDNDAADAYWLSQELLHLWREGLFQALCRRHVNQASVSLARLNGIDIPLPPLPEQHAIAHALQTVQQAREATGRVIAAARELKRSLMRHLFTYGPVPVAQADQVKLQETEIGPIPAHWEVVQLENWADLVTKGASPKWQGFDYCEDGVIFVRSQNVGSGVLDLSDVAYLPKEFNQLQKRSILRKGDLLVNIVGASIGRAALADARVESANVNQAVAVVRLKQGIDPQFVMDFLFTEAGQFQIHRQKKEIARANISLQDINNFLLPLPLVPEQREIVRILSAVDAKIAAEEARREALDALFHTLLHHLMTAKVRVPGVAAKGC